MTDRPTMSVSHPGGVVTFVQITPNKWRDRAAFSYVEKNEDGQWDGRLALYGHVTVCTCSTKEEAASKAFEALCRRANPDYPEL